VKTREKPVFSSNQKKVSRGCYSNTQADEVLGTSREFLKIITEVRCPPRQEAGICADELRHRLARTGLGLCVVRRYMSCSEQI
jgi:hypothetical protein